MTVCRGCGHWTPALAAGHCGCFVWQARHSATVCRSFGRWTPAMSAGRRGYLPTVCRGSGRWMLWPLDTAAVSCGRRGIRRLSVEALAAGRRLCPLDAAATCRLSVEALAAGRSGRWTPALAAGRRLWPLDAGSGRWTQRVSRGRRGPW